MLESESENQRKAIRKGYEYGQVLADCAAGSFPHGEQIDVRAELTWCVEQLCEDPQKRAELLPYVSYGFRQGTLDMLYLGESRYEC